MMISKVISNIDQGSSYIPGVSTATNLVDLFFKCAVLPFLKREMIASNHYFSRLEVKSFARCITLLIPVIGNLIIGLYDFCSKNNDKEYILKNPQEFQLKNLSPRLRDDEEVVLAVATSEQADLRYASPRLRFSREFALKLIEKDPFFMQFLEQELRDDREFAVKAIETNYFSFYYISDRLREDIELATLAVSKDIPRKGEQPGYPGIFASLSPDLRANLHLAHIAIDHRAADFLRAETEVRNNYVLARKALQKMPGLIASPKFLLKADEQLAILVLELNPNLIEHISPETPNYLIHVKNALLKNPNLYRLLPYKVKVGNDEITWTAVNTPGFDMGELPPLSKVYEKLRLKKAITSKEQALAEIERNPGSFQNLPENFQSDLDVVKLAIQKDRDNIFLLSECMIKTPSIQTDITCIFSQWYASVFAVERNFIHSPLFIPLNSNDEQSRELTGRMSFGHAALITQIRPQDSEFNKREAIHKLKILREEVTRGQIYYSNHRLIENRKILDMLIRHNGLFFYYASEELKNDKELAEAAIARTPKALLAIGYLLPHDRVWLTNVLKKYPGALIYSPVLLTKVELSNREIADPLIEYYKENSEEFLQFLSEGKKLYADYEAGYVDEVQTWIPINNLPSFGSSGSGSSYSAAPHLMYNSRTPPAQKTTPIAYQNFHSLSHHAELIGAIAAVNEKISEHLSEKQKATPSLMIALLKNNGLLLKDLPGYQKNQEAVRIACEQNPDAFQYAAENLKNDYDFVADLKRTSPDAVKHASHFVQRLILETSNVSEK